jgi:hypothetical protein
VWKGFKFAVSERLTVLKAVNPYSSPPMPAIKLIPHWKEKLAFCEKFTYVSSAYVQIKG